MNYKNDATSKTPAHIIYVLDVSGSMAEIMPGTNKRKIDFVSDLLEEVAYQIYLRAKKGSVINERYRIAVFAYNDSVINVTNGDYISIKEFVDGVPEFGDLGTATTNTIDAMKVVKELLVNKTITKMKDDYPPPIVCHLTDGQFTEAYGNPSESMKQIMNLDTPDGKVLLENIYLGNKILNKPIKSAKEWSGVLNMNEINDAYAKFLHEYSSMWPERYIKDFNKLLGFSLKSGARMFFPAENVEAVKMAFTASVATPRGDGKVKEG